MLKKLLIASILLIASLNSNAVQSSEKVFLDSEKKIIQEGLFPKEKMIYDSASQKYIFYKRKYKPKNKKHTWVKNKQVKNKNKPIIIYDESGKNALIWNDQIKNFVPLS